VSRASFDRSLQDEQPVDEDMEVRSAIRSRGSGGPGSSESGAAGDEGILRSDRAVCQ
jgi:hypothetical protein